MEKKMVFANIDRKHVKHELLCQKKSKMVGMASCCSIPEKTGNNTESRVSEDSTLIHNQEITFIGTENDYMASQQHENCSYLSEAVTSMAEIDTKICLTDENSQLHNVKIPIKRTQISRNSFDDAPDYTPSGSPQRIQAEDTTCMFNNSDATINVDTFLRRHKTTDLGEKIYKCDVCCASFTKFGNLKHHLGIHTGEKLYMCDICAISFYCIGSLKCHKRAHTGEKPYMCDVCAASFTKSGSLNRHMRIHTGDKRFKCDVCAASFTDASNLNWHKRTHTGVKPFKCVVCAASFAVACHLNRHMRTHTGEKPYICNLCAACFTRNDRLERHKRTHTGEKPYMCDICAASFSRYDNLKYHKRTHT